jgi:hypothetical protein
MFISEMLEGDWKQVDPADIGALTSAPIISNGVNFYGYMDYQINNFLDKLMDGETVVWIKG